MSLSPSLFSLQSFQLSYLKHLPWPCLKLIPFFSLIVFVTYIWAKMYSVDLLSTFHRLLAAPSTLCREGNPWNLFHVTCLLMQLLFVLVYAYVSKEDCFGEDLLAFWLLESYYSIFSDVPWDVDTGFVI